MSQEGAVENCLRYRISARRSPYAVGCIDALSADRMLERLGGRLWQES